MKHLQKELYPSSESFNQGMNYKQHKFLLTSLLGLAVCAKLTSCWADQQTQALKLDSLIFITISNAAPGSRSNMIQSAAFTPNGGAILTFDGGGNMRVWNAATGQQLPMGYLTFKWGTQRYGVIFEGSFSQWMNSSFIVWKSRPHSVPGWLILLVVCFLLAFMVRATVSWFSRKERGPNPVE